MMEFQSFEDSEVVVLSLSTADIVFGYPSTLAHSQFAQAAVDLLI